MYVVILTLGDVLYVCRILQDLTETLQQHGGFVIAVCDVLCLLEHLVQRCRLDLSQTHSPCQSFTQKLKTHIQVHAVVCLAHHFHSVVVYELLGSHAIDLVHKALLV